MSSNKVNKSKSYYYDLSDEDNFAQVPQNEFSSLSLKDNNVHKVI